MRMTSHVVFVTHAKPLEADMSHSCSESNHNLSCKCCDPRICIFVFHQGQDREKLKLNRTWTLMFPKRCPNQFVVPSTSNHPHFQQQGHRAKNDKGWTEHQIIVLFNSACRSPVAFFVPYTALCNFPTKCILHSFRQRMCR